MSVQEEEMEDPVQTSVRIPRDLLKRAKIYAVNHETSLAAILIEALESYLTNNKDPKK